MGCFQQGHPGCSRREVTAIQRHNEHPFRIGFFERKQAEGVFFLHLNEKGKVGRREAKASGWKVQMKGLLTGMTTIVLGFALFSLLIAWAVIPERWMDVCVLVSAVAGVVAGVMTVRMAGNRCGALYGVLCAAVLVCGCAVSGFLLYREIDLTWCLAFGVICTAGGGIAGASGGQKAPRRH